MVKIEKQYEKYELARPIKTGYLFALGFVLFALSLFIAFFFIFAIIIGLSR